MRDEVAEWLRRWTANPMCSARVGSNPILVVLFFIKASEKKKLTQNTQNQVLSSLLLTFSASFQPVSMSQSLELSRIIHCACLFNYTEESGAN